MPLRKMLPKPKPKHKGLMVVPEARRYKIALVPLDREATEFLIWGLVDLGATKPHPIHAGGRVLHVNPGYDFDEVVAWLRSYNDGQGE